MSRHSLGVGIVGAGLIALDEHLPGWLDVPQAKVVAMVDPSPVARQEASRRYEGPRLMADYREMLEDPAINVVDVCAPSALHATLVIEALAAGKHVLCEKPMATTRADAAAMLAAREASGTQLMIVQNMRFEAMMVRLREILERLSLGQIYYARGRWLRRRRVPAKPGFTQRKLSGGGPLLDLGAHVLDLAWWMMGFPRPVSVNAATFDHLVHRPDLGGDWGQWDWQSIDVEDFAAGWIRFENGAVLSLESSWLAFQSEPQLHHLQLFGTQGGLVWPEGHIMGETDRQPWSLRLKPPGRQNTHHALISAFAGALLEERPVPVDPRHSATELAMLEALYLSASTGQQTSVEPFEKPGVGGFDNPGGGL